MTNSNHINHFHTVREGRLTKQAIREAKYIMVRLGQYHDVFFEVTKREALSRLDELNAENVSWHFGPVANGNATQFQLCIG